LFSFWCDLTISRVEGQILVYFPRKRRFSPPN